MVVRTLCFSSCEFSQEGVPFTQLPSALTRLVLLYLSSGEIVRARRICKRLWKLASDESLWGVLFTRDFPGRSVRNDVPASLQYRYRYKTERNWQQARYRCQIIPTDASWSLGGEIVLDDKRIVCELKYSAFGIWNLQNAVFEQLFEGSPGNHIEYVINNGNLLVSYDNTGHGGRVKVWDKTTGRSLWQNMCYPKLIIDGDHLISAVHEGPIPNNSQVVFWDKYTGLQKEVIPAHNINSSTLILEGSHLIFGNHNGEVKIYNKKEGVLARELKAPAASPVSCLIIRDEELIAGYGNGIIHVWNLQNGELVKTLIIDLPEVSALWIHGNHLFATYATAIVGWDLNTERVLFNIEGAIGALVEGDWLFVSKTESGVVEMRRCEDGSLIHTLTGDPDFYSFIIHVNPERIFTRSKNGVVRIWDKRNGSLVQQFFNIDYCSVKDDRIILVSEGKVEVRDFSAVIKV